MMDPVRIRLIAPTTDHRPETQTAIAKDLQLLAQPGAQLSHVQIEHGPLTVRTDDDERQALPGVFSRIREAERDGIHAVVLDCTGDVGLTQARAMITLPVIGPGEVLQYHDNWPQPLLAGQSDKGGVAGCLV